jgi:hypothetical protein
MAKRNKKNLKQRKKKQLKKAFKKAGKVVKKERSVETVGHSLDFPEWYIPPYQEPPVNANKTYEALDKGYQEALDRVYRGTVTTLTHYVNNHVSMSFKCHSCGLVFFGKASHMISDKEHQRHECGKVYGTVFGERHVSVSAIKSKRKGKNLSKQREQHFYEMIWEDYSTLEIASKLKVNPNIIKEYFIKEGLLA